MVPPIDYEGAHAVLAGIGTGPSIWDILRQHGVSRDFTPRGDESAASPASDDEEADHDDETSKAVVVITPPA